MSVCPSTTAVPPARSAAQRIGIGIGIGTGIGDAIFSRQCRRHECEQPVTHAGATGCGTQIKLIKPRFDRFMQPEMCGQRDGHEQLRVRHQPLLVEAHFMSTTGVRRSHFSGGLLPASADGFKTPSFSGRTAPFFSSFPDSSVHQHLGGSGLMRSARASVTQFPARSIR